MTGHTGLDHHEKDPRFTSEDKAHVPRAICYTERSTEAMISKVTTSLMR